MRSVTGFNDLMARKIPVWLHVLLLLLGAVFTVFFGWLAVDTAAGGGRFGSVGRASLIVASFPALVEYAFTQMNAEPDADIRVPRPNSQLTGFHLIRTKSGIHLDGLVAYADEAALISSDGFRVLVGNFTIDGHLKPAALALSAGLEVVKVWDTGENGIPDEDPQPVNRKVLHGLAVLKDGSVIYTFDNGVSIQRVDRCGRRLWAVGGHFSHTVSLDEDEKYVWTISEWYASADDLIAELVKIDTADGKILQRIPMKDIATANPTIDILEVRQEELSRLIGNERNTIEKWGRDPFHLNDVEPLQSSMVDRFPGFAAGDLLVSVRSLNLIFVLDPQTLKVKWWISGATRRQHDPDWQPTGEITVFDNRMGRDYSRVVSITPSTQHVRVLLDGRMFNLYSRIRGRHQITGAGHILVTSPQQGRVLEVNSQGKIVLEIYNLRPNNNEFNYPITEAIWLPKEAFNHGKDLVCVK